VGTFDQNKNYHINVSIPGFFTWPKKIYTKLENNVVQVDLIEDLPPSTLLFTVVSPPNDTCSGQGQIVLKQLDGTVVLNASTVKCILSYNDNKVLRQNSNFTYEAT
jgi:hypothetical protein